MKQKSCCLQVSNSLKFLVLVEVKDMDLGKNVSKIHIVDFEMAK